MFIIELIICIFFLLRNKIGIKFLLIKSTNINYLLKKCKSNLCNINSNIELIITQGGIENR